MNKLTSLSLLWVFLLTATIFPQLYVATGSYTGNGPSMTRREILLSTAARPEVVFIFTDAAQLKVWKTIASPYDSSNAWRYGVAPLDSAIFDIGPGAKFEIGNDVNVNSRTYWYVVLWGPAVQSKVYTGAGVSEGDTMQVKYDSLATVGLAMCTGITQNTWNVWKGLGAHGKGGLGASTYYIRDAGVRVDSFIVDKVSYRHGNSAANSLNANGNVYESFAIDSAYVETGAYTGDGAAKIITYGNNTELELLVVDRDAANTPSAIIVPDYSSTLVMRTSASNAVAGQISAISKSNITVPAGAALINASGATHDWFKLVNYSVELGAKIEKNIKRHDHYNIYKHFPGRK